MTHRLLLPLLLILASVSFTSCSSDEPDAPQPVGDEWIDPVFAKTLEDRGYITDAETVTPADVANLTDIDVSGTYENRGNITSLRGIEYFSNLQRLDCSYNSLSQLDLSKNTRLTKLWCYWNQLTQLDLSKNTQLLTLGCSSNQLSQLDLSKNTKLTSLDCSGNQLTQLDLSKNTQLTTLWCFSNRLTQLDISKNTQLTDLSCSSNQLTQLDISQNIKLADFDCDNNPGENGTFRVKAWFDNASIPQGFTYYSWKYNGSTVTIDYYK